MRQILGPSSEAPLIHRFDFLIHLLHKGCQRQIIDPFHSANEVPFFADELQNARKDTLQRLPEMKQLVAALWKGLLRFDIVIKALALEWPVKNKFPWKIVVLAAVTIMASPSLAAETTTYTYDALGRLIQSKSTGTVNNGLQTDTTFDAAGNRSNQTVTGSVNNSPPVRAVIVLPLNGYTIIPLS